jgi:hypothetical protein
LLGTCAKQQEHGCAACNVEGIDVHSVVLRLINRVLGDQCFNMIIG